MTQIECVDHAGILGYLVDKLWAFLAVIQRIVVEAVVVMYLKESKLLVVWQTPRGSKGLE